MAPKKIALVSATYNAVPPMTEYMQKNAPEFKIINYLDGYLMDKIRNEGGITDVAKIRVMDMLAKACEDVADGIILTCTVFSDYQPYLSKIFSAPIITPDAAMHDTVSRMGGKTAIICTFDGTVETTKNQYLSFCAKNGMPEEVTMFTVPEAFAAYQAGRRTEGDALVREKVMELDACYDQIILAQISMSQAAESLVTEHAKVFTSPASAVAEMHRILSQ